MRPVLVVDGDCGMCTTAADFVRRRLRRSPADFDIATSQGLDLPALGLTQRECDEALQWVGADGSIASGHEAVAAALRAGSPWVQPVGHLLSAPGVRRVAALAYRWVARHRYMFPGGTRACALPDTTQQGEA